MLTFYKNLFYYIVSKLLTDKQRMPWTAKLARQLYHERIVELKSDILLTEKKFR